MICASCAPNYAGTIVTLLHITYPPLLPSLAVTIGFIPDYYSVKESAGSVSLVVEVISGQFASGVSRTVQLNLQDGTALGMYRGQSWAVSL